LNKKGVFEIDEWEELLQGKAAAGEYTSQSSRVGETNVQR